MMNIECPFCGQEEDGSDGCAAVISFRGDVSRNREKTIEKLKKRAGCE